MTQKYTPGPWDDYGTDIIRDAKGSIVAEIYTGSYGRCPEGERAANARLIASAPELLAALTEVTNLFDQWGATRPYSRAGREPMVTRALAAIRKAEGVAP